MSEAEIQHERELRRKAEDALVEARGLVGNIAHDFNNLIAVILTYTKVVLAELPEGDRLIPDLLQIDKAGEKAARLSEQLAALSCDKAPGPK